MTGAITRITPLDGGWAVELAEAAVVLSGTFLTCVNEALAQRRILIWSAPSPRWIRSAAQSRCPTMGEAICFRVVKEPYGWAVRMGQSMMTPFRSRRLAIEHANGFAEALRDHGEPAEVIIEGWPTASEPNLRGRSSRLSPRRQGR